MLSVRGTVSVRSSAVAQEVGPALETIADAMRQAGEFGVQVEGSELSVDWPGRAQKYSLNPLNAYDPVRISVEHTPEAIKAHYRLGLRPQYAGFAAMAFLPILIGLVAEPRQAAVVVPILIVVFIGLHLNSLFYFRRWLRDALLRAR